MTYQVSDEAGDVNTNEMRKYENKRWSYRRLREIVAKNAVCGRVLLAYYIWKDVQNVSWFDRI